MDTMGSIDSIGRGFACLWKRPMSHDDDRTMSSYWSVATRRMSIDRAATINVLLLA